MNNQDKKNIRTSLDELRPTMKDEVERIEEILETIPAEMHDDLKVTILTHIRNLPDDMKKKKKFSNKFINDKKKFFSKYKNVYYQCFEVGERVAYKVTIFDLNFAVLFCDLCPLRGECANCEVIVDHIKKEST